MRGRRKPYDPWLDLEWEEDALARALVDANPDGMTLDVIGEHLGLTRERVRQIQGNALEKLRDPDLGCSTFESGRFAFASPLCACGETFVRLTGRQELCRRCSAERRATTPKTRSKEPKWAPTKRLELIRRKLAAERLEDAVIFTAIMGTRKAEHMESNGLERVEIEARGQGSDDLFKDTLCVATLSNGERCAKAGKHGHESRLYCGIHHPDMHAQRQTARLKTLKSRKAVVQAEPDEPSYDRPENRSVGMEMTGCLYEFPIRSDFIGKFSLPSDITSADVQRIGRWLESLPLDSSPTS